MSIHKCKRCSKGKFLPTSDSMNWVRSPHSAFSYMSTGQTVSSPTPLVITSQQMPTSVTIFAWSRITGWPYTRTSGMSVRNIVNSSDPNDDGVTLLNAKLVCGFICDWCMRAVAPRPTFSKAGCHVMPRISIPRHWQIAGNDMRSQCSFVDWFHLDTPCIWVISWPPLSVSVSKLWLSEHQDGKIAWLILDGAWVRSSCGDCRISRGQSLLAMLRLEDCKNQHVLSLQDIATRQDSRIF